MAGVVLENDPLIEKIDDLNVNQLSVEKFIERMTQMVPQDSSCSRARARTKSS